MQPPGNSKGNTKILKPLQLNEVLTTTFSTLSYLIRPTEPFLPIAMVNFSTKIVSNNSAEYPLRRELFQNSRRVSLNET